jgi:hypothetical protein
MGKWDGVREAQGVHDAQGVKAVIFDVEKGETGEQSQTPGCLMFTVHLRITEPPSCEGYELRDWFTIGTKDDKRAKKDDTWHRTEAGPGRLARLLKRAGVDPTDDDEEWMDALIDKEVCFHMTKGADRDGNGYRNRVGMYFRESDDQFVGIGEPLADEGKRGGRGGGGAARGATPGRGGNARGNGSERTTRRKDDDDDDAPKGRAAKGKGGDEDEDDEAPAKTARGRQVARRADPDED